jgi:hypothetical protein
MTATPWERTVTRRELLAGAAALAVSACAPGSTVRPRSSPSAAAAPSQGGPGPAGWLRVSGNRILRDGAPWRARGANVQDTRGCNACTYEAPHPEEVMRRIDTLVDGWGANFVRLCLESYASAEGRVQWRGVLDDPEYLADVRTIVDHVGSKPGVCVLLSVQVDPTFTKTGAGVAAGWPTEATIAIWRKLAGTFAHDPHVLFGVANEPQANQDGSLDGACWTAMSRAVATIREAERSAGGGEHVVAVQGTRLWARRLDHYVDHPMQPGSNVVYETHVYNPASDFDALFVAPSRTLPVIIGEFGPLEGSMRLADCQALMARARALDIPHLGWTFHMRCPPNMLVDHSGNGCGAGMPLEPTAWGRVMQEGLRASW